MKFYKIPFSMIDVGNVIALQNLRCYPNHEPDAFCFSMRKNYSNIDELIDVDDIFWVTVIKTFPHIKSMHGLVITAEYGLIRLIPELSEMNTVSIA